MMHPSKRTLLVLLLLLTGGAILNVAVAWGCAIVHGEVESEWAPYHNPREFPLVIHVTSRLGYEQVRGVERSGTLLDRYKGQVRKYTRRVWWPSEAVGVSDTAFGVATGWPMLTLSSCFTLDHAENLVEHELVKTPNLVGGWSPHQPSYRSLEEAAPAILCLRPIWPGFAINTILYAGILWLVFLAPFQFRRYRRIKRGLCPACAYPVGASEVCTECGKAEKA